MRATLSPLRDRAEGVAPAPFKAAMRRFASGVTVVTSRSGASVNGMTATAVCSVSADPPLALVVVNRASASHALIVKGQAFALNILAEGQEGLATYFAGGDAKTFEAAPHAVGETGCPLLLGCAAHVECVVENDYDEGTHTIFVGRAIHVSSADLAPLIYCDADFQSLQRV
ncbi:flavin reductase family protein [Hansschlegelia plantiphila]|uniref:Flavin reductase n=1 Tax=Hansschlegelia plantiphila TaxID=374655 RepID=A0A9W6J2I3_9HYPH|nr:flavin reductase family protein [Hansschlegelia plantiphila]GLK69646.1 flavin reductase [Hansschlegelia plantiphila]